jgi:DNA-binding NarL/FixJ family response regulator
MRDEEFQVIKVLLVDDRAVVRRGLQMRLDLEPDIEIVGQADSGQEAVSLARQLAPDIVVMDVEMPGMDGITATRELCALSPRAAVVVLSIHDDADTRARAQEAGAAAFVEKQSGADRLLNAIRQAAWRAPQSEL